MKITNLKWKYPKLYLGTYGDLCFGWFFGTIIIGKLYDIIVIFTFILTIIILLSTNNTQN